jgi:hypothetical protein
MGVWAEGIFDSDASGEWADELIRSDRPEKIAEALNAVVQGPLGIDESIEGLVAAEVVAALRGHPLRGLYAPLKDWVDSNPYLSTTDEQRLALAALDLIRNGSDLANEMGHGNKRWLAQLDKLRDRLTQQPKLRQPAKPRATISPEVALAAKRLDLPRNSVQLTKAGRIKSLDLCNHDDRTLSSTLPLLASARRLWFSIWDNDVRNSDEAFASLDRFSQLEELNLSDTLITDATLSRLARLTKLKRLLLARTQITDAGLTFLSGLVNLEELDLSASLGKRNLSITGEGLACLRDMTRLYSLNLQGTAADDSVLPWLERMPQLCHLDLRNTKMKGIDQKRHHRESSTGETFSPGSNP